jgi:mRNA-degrading endonuclease RelE of RelBE toxin-antitoxin system
MKSFTVESYWKSYKELSETMQKQADAKFELWKENPFHPSLHFKCVNSENNIWSVRVNIDHRALAVK